jgi:hypothetical protein
MPSSRLRLTVRWLRWLMFAASIIGMDVAALCRVVTARSSVFAGVGGGPLWAHTTYYAMYDGSHRRVVHNWVTGSKTTTVERPATPEGLCRVWWPAVAAGLLTLLAIRIALSPSGQWFIAEMPLPRMTTRRWMISVAALGTEGGLVISTLRNSGVDPLHAPWIQIFISLVVLHALAFLPLGVALLYQYLRNRQSQNEHETAMGRL